MKLAEIDFGVRGETIAIIDRATAIPLAADGRYRCLSDWLEADDPAAAAHSAY